MTMATGQRVKLGERMDAFRCGADAAQEDWPENMLGDIPGHLAERPALLRSWREGYRHARRQMKLAAVEAASDAERLLEQVALDLFAEERP